MRHARIGLKRQPLLLRANGHDAREMLVPERAAVVALWDLSEDAHETIEPASVECFESEFLIERSCPQLDAWCLARQSPNEGGQHYELCGIGHGYPNDASCIGRIEAVGPFKSRTHGRKCLTDRDLEFNGARCWSNAA